VVFNVMDGVLVLIFPLVIFQYRAVRGIVALHE
jgi:hypothetical protein